MTTEERIAALRALALELLGLYHGAETSVIWERSGRIDEDERALAQEIETYRQKIKTLAPQEEALEPITPDPRRPW